MGTAESYWSDPLEFLPSLPRENYLAGNEFDWQDEIFGEAFQQEHQISLSGGTEKNNYYASISYTDQNGMVKNTDMQKFAATINMSQKIGSWLTVGMNTQLSQVDRGGVVPEIDQAFYLSPWSNPYNEDGSYNRYPMYTTAYWRNPYQNIDGVMDKKTNTVFTAWYADIILPVKGLSYRSNFGYTYKQYQEGSYYGKTTFIGEPLGGKAEIKNNSYNDWTWENVVKYDRNFGRHHLDLTGMISAQETKTMDTSMTGKNYLNDENAYNNIDAAQGEKEAFSDMKETSLASYMGRINYNYDSRYLLTFTGRYDGYSAFGKNNKWAFFPSVAAGWVISEESFFKNWNMNQIDFLKLRLSYGANGNQAISAYQTLTKLTQQDYIYGDGSTFAGGLYSDPYNEVGNPNLKWETTYTFNAGLDYSFFNGRLNGNLDIYSANTHDLLMKRTVPIMNGYTSMMDNIGKTNSKGFELVVNSINMEKKNFVWSTSFSFSGNWNKIKELREDGQNDIANSWFIGQPVKVFYDYKVIGTWQNSEIEEAASYGAIPGDAKLLDKDGDGKITSDDRVIIGSKIPIWTAGLTNSFTYKNFTFSFFLNGVFDVKKENGMLNFIGKQFDKCTNYITTVDYWTPENPSNEATRLGYNPVNSHKFYDDASYVRIQDITLGYDFPQSLVNRMSLQKLGVYLNVSNVYTFSGINDYSINPEQKTIGSSGYPVPRTFAFGVNVTF
jgi:TonB-linked SusC/RagA family outer membrane protein